jgi:hypothetical protein
MKNDPIRKLMAARNENATVEDHVASVSAALADVAVLDPAAEATLTLAAMLAHLVERALGPEPALDVVEPAFYAIRDELGENHPTALALMFEYAELTGRAGTPGDAVMLYEALAEATRIQFGPASPPARGRHAAVSTASDARCRRCRQAPQGAPTSSARRPQRPGNTTRRSLV